MGRKNDKTLSHDDIMEKVIESEKEWRSHIFREIDLIRKDQNTLLQKVAHLEVKSGVWGLLGGIIPVTVMIAANFFRR